MPHQLKQKIFAVIPAYNEEKTISEVVRSTKNYVSNVIVIDDCSTDRTAKLAEESGALVIQHIINRGLGASLSSGIKTALALSADVIVTLDADKQHNPENIPILIEPILGDICDIVIGSRFKSDTKDMPMRKKIGNYLLNKLTQLLYSINCTDTQSGFRALNRKAASLINIKLDRYGVASEIIGEIKKHNLRVLERPIDTIYLDKRKGTTALDGLKIFFDLLLRRFF